MCGGHEATGWDGSPCCWPGPVRPSEPAFGALWILVAVAHHPPTVVPAAEARPAALLALLEGAFGLLQSGRALGFLVGPILGGILFDQAYAAPYLGAGVFLIADGARRQPGVWKNPCHRYRVCYLSPHQ